MPSYKVVLRRERVTGEVEVSPDGKIVSADASLLRKAIGLHFVKFNAWAKGRGGIVTPVLVAREGQMQSHVPSSWMHSM
jgi:hypothetical protein